MAGSGNLLQKVTYDTCFVYYRHSIQIVHIFNLMCTISFLPAYQSKYFYKYDVQVQLNLLKRNVYIPRSMCQLVAMCDVRIISGQPHGTDDVITPLHRWYHKHTKCHSVINVKRFTYICIFMAKNVSGI